MPITIKAPLIFFFISFVHSFYGRLAGLSSYESLTAEYFMSAVWSFISLALPCFFIVQGKVWAVNFSFICFLVGQLLVVYTGINFIFVVGIESPIAHDFLSKTIYSAAVSFVFYWLLYSKISKEWFVSRKLKRGVESTKDIVVNIP